MGQAQSQSYICYVNRFLREMRHKKWNQEYKQNQFLFFNFFNNFFIFRPLELRK